MSPGEIIQIVAVVAATLVAIFGGLGALLLYLYNGNETKNAELIAGKLDAIVEKLDVLFTKDQRRSETISEIKTDLAKQIQRCDDREASCPGKHACRTLERRSEER